MNNKTISTGFIIAGLANLTVLIFSKFFTNSTIPETDPVVMSYFGLLMIAVWGLAYIAVAKNYQNVKWLIAVFAFEKLIYGYVWLQWILHNDLSVVYDKDILAGLFFSIYGVNDWIFFVFFLIVFIKLQKNQLRQVTHQVVVFF